MRFFTLIITVCIFATAVGSERKSNIKLSSQEIIEFTPSIIIHYNGKTSEIVPYPKNVKMFNINVFSDEIVFTSIENGILMGYKHTGGDNVDYLLTYDLYNKEFYVGNSMSWQTYRWPGSLQFSNGTLGIVDGLGISAFDETYGRGPSNALLLDQQCDLNLHQLHFNYGKSHEWKSKGLAFNNSNRQYILLFAHQKTGQVGIAVFNEEGHQQNKFLLPGVSYPYDMGKGAMSSPMYVFPLLNNQDILVATGPGIRPNWLLKVNLSKESFVFLDDKETELIIESEHLRGVKENTEWEFLPKITAPPFYLERNDYETTIISSASHDKIISVDPYYSKLMDWESDGKNGFYAILN